MWLITNFGFFSIVQKSGEKDLTVRARVKKDLEKLREKYLPELGEIKENVGTDYLYRAHASHTALAKAIGCIVQDINYDNFKNCVAREQGHHRAHVYSRVWDNLLALEDKDK